MTPLDFYFYTIFGAGCVLAGVLSLIATRCRWLSATLLLATAICIFWSSLLFGLEIGFRAWQAIPNPPEEAYSDSGPSIVLVGGVDSRNNLLHDCLSLRSTLSQIPKMDAVLFLKKYQQSFEGERSDFGNNIETVLSGRIRL